MRNKALIAALALGQIAMAGQATAACVASDIAGTWYTHGVFFDYTGAAPGEWMYCKLVVSSSGGVSTTSSQCLLSGGQTLAVSASSLRVSSACAISGAVTVSRNGSTLARMVMQRGQMDQSHRSFTALGYDSTDSKIKFSLQAVERHSSGTVVQ